MKNDLCVLSNQQPTGQQAGMLTSLSVMLDWFSFSLSYS